MIFTTLKYYFLFLLPTVLLFRLVPAKWRPRVIVISGCLFFSWFAYEESGRIAGILCLGIFLWESIFSRLYRPASKICLVGVVQAICILFVFKYWNFASGMLPTAANLQMHWKSAFLPLGISFFTFEFIHFAIDVYKGKIEGSDFWDYFAFILFFPTMVAGPIKRFQDFGPKLRQPSTDWVTDVHRGLTRILAGLAKKLAVASLMTALTKNLNIQAIATAPRWALLLWIFAYGIQIYFDFSAYSDIAIGSARLMGIAVPENFSWPYLQKNITLFWQHWHMSLSKWLTDYVYIPLGGSRVKPPRILSNLMITMLVSGLWHGAGWNFVVWGAWHGACLCIHRLFRTFRTAPEVPGTFGNVLSWMVTFSAVTLGWAFFCMDINTALFFFKKLAIG